MAPPGPTRRPLLPAKPVATLAIIVHAQAVATQRLFVSSIEKSELLWFSKVMLSKLPVSSLPVFFLQFSI
jgi:hypothetical protein